MKKRIKMLVLALIIVIAGGCGYFIYESRYDADSDMYLTSRNESRTFDTQKGTHCSDNELVFDYDGFTGRWSFFKVTPEEDGVITIECNSTLNSGKVYIVAMDSSYKMAAKGTADGHKEISFDGKMGESYYIRMAGKDGSGHFDVKVESGSKSSIEYLDFFGGKL